MKFASSLSTMFFTGLLLTSIVTACSPTVTVQAPDKPITVNLNVKIDHEVKVKVDKDLDNVLGEDSDLF